MAQPRESARKHMKEEAADELLGVEPHHLALVPVSVVAPSEADLPAIEVDEPMVGDGGLVGLWGPGFYGNRESQQAVMTRIFR